MMAFSVYSAVDSGSVTRFFAVAQDPTAPTLPAMYVTLVAVGGAAPPTVTLTFESSADTPIPYNQGRVTLESGTAAIDVGYGPVTTPPPGAVGPLFQLQFFLDAGTTVDMLDDTMWSIELTGAPGQSFAWVVADTPSDALHLAVLPFLTTQSATVAGPLSVTGPAAFTTLLAQNASVSGPLSVAGTTTLAALSAHSASIAGPLSVTGTASIGGPLSITGGTTVGGPLSVSGGATVAGSLSVSGTATFATLSTHSASVAGSLSVTGGATVGGPLSVSGTGFFAGSLGIGTSTPTHIIHVRAADAVGLFESSGTQAYLRLATAEGLNNRVEFCNRPGGRAAVWVAGGGDAINATRDGLVGIGTTAPTHILHVRTADAVGLFESSGTQAYLRLATAEGLDNRVEFCNRPGGRATVWVAGGGDAINVLRDGRVGVGTTAPVGGNGDLTVNGQITVNGAYVRVHGAAGEAAYIGADGAGGDVEVGSGNPATSRLSAWNNGNGTYLDVAGRNWVGHSDVRAKRDIETLTGALDKVLRLRPVAFRWRSDAAELDAVNGKTIGMIAQEVQEIIPEAVFGIRNGDLGISYQAITSLLLAAIQEQDERIAALDAMVKRGQL